MFQIMCMEIREPIQKWMRQVSLIVGEGSNAFVESDESVSEEHEMKETDSHNSKKEEVGSETLSKEIAIILTRRSRPV